MQDDLVTAVQWTVDNDLVDPARVAIYGLQYGAAPRAGPHDLLVGSITLGCGWGVCWVRVWGGRVLGAVRGVCCMLLSRECLMACE